MSALVLTGNLQLQAHGGTDDDTTGVVMAGEVTEFKIEAKVTEITVPATMTSIEHSRGGATDYMVTISYLSNDLAGSLFRLLYANLGGTVVGAGNIRNTTVGATSPEWTFEFVVTEASLGAVAQGLSTGSATFPLIGPPTRLTS